MNQINTRAHTHTYTSTWTHTQYSEHIKPTHMHISHTHAHARTRTLSTPHHTRTHNERAHCGDLRSVIAVKDTEERIFQQNVAIFMLIKERTNSREHKVEKNFQKLKEFSNLFEHDRDHNGSKYFLLRHICQNIFVTQNEKEKMKS